MCAVIFYSLLADFKSVMSKRIRDPSWKEDDNRESSLKTYISQGLQRTEILSFMIRDFDEYSLSLSSLDRRLKHFNINTYDYDAGVEVVKKAVEEEIKGPGKLLGYRALHLKIRQKHGLNVPRDLVYAAMVDVDLPGLEARQPGFKKKGKKGNFVSMGPNCSPRN